MNAAPTPPSQTRRNFTLVFLALIGLAVGATFFTFRHFAREGFAKRRSESRENIRELALRLRTLDPVPEDVETAALHFPQDKPLLTSPSWPDQPGYFFVPEVRVSSDPPSTLLLYENVPMGKQKIGRWIARADGEVEEVSEAEFQQRLNAQRSAWEVSGRPFHPRLLRVP
jgi:hypothetical protein